MAVVVGSLAGLQWLDQAVMNPRAMLHLEDLDAYRMILADTALPDSVRGKGVLTGIATGIKLTPAFFILYLLVTRRFRAAATATGTLLSPW